MSRNFIFNARKQGGSAQNLNLRCGPGASKRSFGTHRDPGAYGHGHLLGASCDDLGIRRHGLLQGLKCYDVGAGGHRLLRDTKCYNFVACIDRLFRDIGRCDLSVSGYSLSQDIGRRGFIAQKYELCSRSNCDYSVSVLLSGAARYGFAARNSALLRGDTYRSSSASTYLRRSPSMGACLWYVGTNRDARSRRDSGASAILRRSSSTNGRLQSSMSGRSQRNFNAGVCLRCVGTKQSVHLYCKFGANRDTFLRCGFDTCGFSAKCSTQKTILGACHSLFCDASGLGSEQNPALDTFCAVRNFLSLHVARDFKNFGSVNLKKFNLVALQFANLKKQIRADKGVDKSANARNLTSFGREIRTPGRLGFENKIPVPRRSFLEDTVSAPHGLSLGRRNCKVAQNSKVCASDFTQNFKNFDWGLEAKPVQNCKISALNFMRNFKNSTRDREAEPTQSFKDQNLAQDFSQNGKSYDQNSTQGFSQSGGSTDPNSVQGFSQSAKNSDRNSKANSMQSQTEPVSPQELKNLEPCPAQKQELGFYAPKFKDERARNFFSHPMRAFILCACFFAALGALSFLAPDALAIDYVGAHKFYFLFLAPSCIYAAFLLTALPDWTNFEGSLKPVSLAFAACLIAAFIASFLNLRLAAAIVALFWAVFFIFAARLLWLDKNSNNFSILAVLAAFCACSAAYGASGDEKFLLSFVHINVAAIAVVSYRISVVIGNEALREGGLKDAVFIPNFIYKNLAAFLAFSLALATPFLSEVTCGFIALGIGFLFLAKLRELHYAEILSRHYMAFYYALQAACAAGYLWLGAALIRGGYATAPLHVIAICYMYGAILFVGMIAGQRHSGISPLNFPRLSRTALVLALLAGALRAVFAGASFVLYVMIPSVLFIAAVALYLINFVPIFLKNPFSADPD